MQRHSELTMVKRFLLRAWSTERINIHKMKIGDVLEFAGDKDYLRSTVARLNDAYEGYKVWEIKLFKGTHYITRIKVKILEKST